MWKNTTPDQFNLTLLLKKIISKQGEQHYVRTHIKSVLQELPFIPKKAVSLHCTDLSYKHRYSYAVQFWKDKTSNCNETISKEQACVFIAELKDELNSKEGFYTEEDFTGEGEKFSDSYFFEKSQTGAQTARKQSTGNSGSEKPVLYVTCKCDNECYVKSANKAEAQIHKEDILCGYELICVGDEVEVISPATAGKPTVNITKSTGLAEKPIAKAQFIQDLLAKCSSGESVIGIHYILCHSCRGIWDCIKNDNKLFEDSVYIKDVWKLSSLLARKLQKQYQTSLCETFCEDLSASLFFVSALPSFVKANANLLSSEEIGDLESLLELMMEIVPHMARNISKVAEQLANVMHVINSEPSGTEGHSKCNGVTFLTKLCQILAKSVPGSQNVDTSNCEWNELPTIPTEKEILSVFDLKSLEAIKDDKPYESTEQYLEINYKLLREECFRNLCTGIQDFREGKSSDGRKMKMYRTTLKTVYRGDSEVFLELNCEDYYKEEKSHREEGEDTSNSQILYGSLMCISLNRQFDSFIWATVVKFEQPQDLDRKIVGIRLCSDRNRMENIAVVLELSKLTNRGDHALMAESPSFFRAFGPSMNRLKEMKEKDVPLKDQLVFAKTSDPPEYTQDKKVKCDWSIIFKRQSGYEFSFPNDEPLSPIEQYKHLKEGMGASQCLLDETQMLAIENFLQNKVALIQGPPGTGKSFLGEKILRLMLSMEIHKRYKGPILVVTFKNLALDHFLENCLQYTENIVRIGTTENATVAEISLNKVRKNRRRIAKEQRHHDMEATEKMRRSCSKFKSLFKFLSNPIFTLQAFFKVASEFHIRSLLTMSPDENENIKEGDLDEFMSSWKKNHITTQFKELVKKSLSRWLPKACIEEKYRNYVRKKSDSAQCGNRRVSRSESQGNEECHEDAIDNNVLARERQQDAVEDDLMQGDSEDTPAKAGDIFDNEPLAEDTHIPFDYKKDQDVEKDVDDEENLWEMTDEERVDFIRALQCRIVREFSKAVNDYQDNARRHQQILDHGTVELLKEYDVIGMTVTGAAARLHLLNQLEPCAVIVEEAAEIIEGQLVSVLPPTIQHLVMLGDQEQLRPRISCYKLKKEKNLDCSMFERLINNKMPFQQLGQQCRMRKDILELLRSLRIYKDLQTNHEKTKGNFPPKCIERSLFFLKHTSPDKQIHGTKSIYNQREINDILKVAEYLLKNGYPPCKVTVLCPYRGQVDKMKTAFGNRSSEPSEKYLTKLRNINITTVDSFQGDENDVILLSLVRSNREEKIGFFGETNRICVAVSRARCGLYMFGNISVYSKSENWRKIIRLLEEKCLVGTKFPFKDDCDGVSSEKVGVEEFCDATKLSPREAELLAGEIILDCGRIARLSNLQKSEIDNVTRDDKHYPEPINKAARILSLISEKPEFSRKRLAEDLGEVGYVDLVDKVLKGTLRVSAGPDVSMSSSAPSN